MLTVVSKQYWRYYLSSVSTEFIFFFSEPKFKLTSGHHAFAITTCDLFYHMFICYWGKKGRKKTEEKWDIYYFEKHKLVISGLPK